MFEYHAKCTSVYDGDTITVDIDLGLNSWLKNQKLRLVGIDTPEMRGSEKLRGKMVRDWLRAQILDQEITIKTHKSRNKGKYGRWLVRVFIGDRDLNQEMLDKGFAEPFMVGK